MRSSSSSRCATTCSSVRRCRPLPALPNKHAHAHCASGRPIRPIRPYALAVADRLVGIYKTNNCTKSVAIDPSAFTVPTARVC